MRSLLTVVLVSSSVAPAPAAPIETTVVACAPGYPGNTEQAQPSMDAFAAVLQRSLDGQHRHISAVYHEALEAGLERIAAADAAVALVPLPFYLEYRTRLGLTPRLLVEQEAGLTESWTLVAAKTSGAPPAGLAGWQLAGMPVYSERFVRGVALAGWGPLSSNAELKFTSRVLSSLRQASRGESVAVLLDGAQAAASVRLPFAADLEQLHRSRPVPTSLLCTVAGRLADEEWNRLAATLLQLHEQPAGAEALAELRLVRFHPLQQAELHALEAAFDEVPD